jgi:hypothetical protein
MNIEWKEKEKPKKRSCPTGERDRELTLDLKE